ncbi:hypothetical protein BT69DRAFT_1285477, partial [Atractiella rhizophila]
CNGRRSVTKIEGTEWYERRGFSPVTLVAIALLPLQLRPASALLVPPRVLTYPHCRAKKREGS